MQLNFPENDIHISVGGRSATVLIKYMLVSHSQEIREQLLSTGYSWIHALMIVLVITSIWSEQFVVALNMRYWQCIQMVA